MTKQAKEEAAPAEPWPVPFAFTPADASRHSGMPVSTLRDRVDRGDLPVAVYGGGTTRAHYVILREDLEAYLRSLRVRRPHPGGEFQLEAKL